MRLSQLLRALYSLPALGLLLYSLPAAATPQAVTDTLRYAEEYDKVTRNGAWCWFSDPRAIYVGDMIYGGFVDNEGSIWAFRYDPATGRKRQHKVYDKLHYDDHANPSVMALADGRIALFFSAHGGTKDSPLYCAVGKHPGRIDEWDVQAVDIDMEGKLGVCYSNPVTLSAENNRTYVFFRGRNFKPTYVYSDNTLRNWSAPATIVVNDPGYGQEGRPYMKVATDGKDKIFFAFTDGHPRDRATNSIYFMMYSGGKLRRADGTVISDGLTQPVSPNQTDKVYDATKTYDKAWIWDVAIDSAGNPALVYARFSNRNNVHSYWHARWNGTAWENRKITDAGQWFPRNDQNDKNFNETENNYSGGVYLDHNNPNVAYTSRPIGGIYEIERWTLTDTGKSGKWLREAVTAKSGRDNVRPYVVRNYPARAPHVMWMYNYKYPHFRAYESALRIDRKANGFSPRLDTSAVKKVANAVADWQIRDTEEHPFESHAARGWRNGVLYNGMFDWAEASGKKRHFRYLEKIFDKESWQLGNRMYNADDICVGQAYLDMYARFGKEKMLVPTQARAEWVLTHKPGDNIDIRNGSSDRWWWCDALYMAPAVYSRLYAITGDKKFMAFADKEFKATYDHLYDKEERLFLRDGKYFDKREKNGEKVFWGRGNGWVMGGLVEILKTLPEKDRKFRPFYEQLFREMSERVAGLQAKDGFWRASLLDPASYPGPETSGTGLFTYALAYGINSGLLDRKKYLPTVRKGWKALVSSVDTEGKVGWVQPVGQAPGQVEKRSNLTYGTGAFLQAAAEIYKLAE